MYISDDVTKQFTEDNWEKWNLINRIASGENSEYGIYVSFNGFDSGVVSQCRVYIVDKKAFQLQYRSYYKAYFFSTCNMLDGFVFTFYRNGAGNFFTSYGSGVLGSTSVYYPTTEVNKDNFFWTSWGYNFAFDATVANFNQFRLVSGIPAPNTHPVTVNYEYEDGTQAADSVTQSIEVGKDFEIVSPSITGYTPSQAKITGTMGESSQEYTVTYKKNIHKLTVNYVYASGGTASNTVWKTLGYGDSYSIPSPILPNLTADKPIVSGTMLDNDLNVTVTYQSSVINHTLTINYLYQDGSKAVDSVVKKLPCNVSYFEKSPEIQGYTADKPIVSGRMPDSDYTETVTYIKVDNGGSGDSGDGGGSGGSGGDSGGDSGGGDGNDPFQPPDGGGSGGGGNDPFQPPDGGGDSGSGNDPFQPPDSGGSGGGWSGYDPFKPPSGGSGWSGYDPFKRPQQNNWIGSNPFEKPKQSIPYTRDPFQKPEDAPTKGDAHQAFLYFIGGMK